MHIHSEPRRHFTAREPGLDQLLNAFEQPAYLLSLNGALLFANHAASRSERAPAWVPRYARLEPYHGAPTGARRVKLRSRLRELWLVTAPAAQQRGAIDWSQFGLSPSLEQIASLIAQGMRDKEIAQATGRPLATVRAYVARIYKRVGVTSRVELALCARRLEYVPGDGAPSLGTTAPLANGPNTSSHV